MVQGSQAGRLDHVSGSQRQLNGGHQARVQSDQMVLMVARQGSWTGGIVAKDAQGKLISSVRLPRDLLKQGQSDIPKEIPNLLLLRAC
jgi:hypothetical protein